MAQTLCWLLLAGMVASHAPAPEKYTIKFRKAAKGDSTLVSRDESSDTKTVIQSEEKVVQSAEQKVREVFKYREDILEKPAGKRATRLTRTYEKAETTRDGKSREFGFQGKTVLIEKKDGKYRFLYADGKELSKDDAAPLVKEFAKEKDEEDDLDHMIMPKSAVAEGETWKLQMSNILKQMSQDDKLAFDAAQASGTGKLVRVYTKDGSQFGVMEFTIELPIKQMGDPGSRIDFKSGSSFTLTMNLDACIDGSLPTGTAKHRFHMTGTGTPANSPQLSVVLSFLSTGSDTREPAPKK